MEVEEIETRSLGGREDNVMYAQYNRERR